MPSRDVNKRVRLPSVAAKITGIRGLKTDEKHLLLRITSLLDTYVVQRNIANNAIIAGRELNENEVPAPINVGARLMIGGVELFWDAVDYDFFELYEVQQSTSSTFINPREFPVSTNRIVIKDLGGINWFRVRTVSRKGQVSDWVQPFGGAVSIPNTVFDNEEDQVEPENRTLIYPNPQLISAPLSVGIGSRFVVGLGGDIGPSPLTFADPSFGGDVDFKHQVSYTLSVNNSVISVDEVGLPTKFYDGFYDDYYRTYVTPTGSFAHFFDIVEFNQSSDAAVTLVDFLLYLRTPHRQTGTIDMATLGIIQH